MMAAGFFKAPELVLEQKEADALANAIAEVERHYNVTISPELRAWLGLASVAGMIYGPRAWLILQRRKEERARPANPAPPATGLAVVGGTDAPKKGDAKKAAPPAQPASAQAAGMTAADFGL